MADFYPSKAPGTKGCVELVSATCLSELTPYKRIRSLQTECNVFESVMHALLAYAGAVGGKVQEFGDAAIDKIVAAVRDTPLTLDAAKAEWIADQLLEAGEHGILLPVNVVLDAYVRGKSRRVAARPTISCYSNRALCPH